jgi:hypothetical protein
MSTTAAHNKAAASPSIGAAAGNKLAEAAAHGERLQPNSGADALILKLVKSAAGSIVVRTIRFISFVCA